MKGITQRIHIDVELGGTRLVPLLSGFGYAVVYSVIGGIWIVLALFVLRASMRVMRYGETRELAVISSTVS